MCADSGALEQGLDGRDQDGVVGANDLAHAWYRELPRSRSGARKARQGAHLPLNISVSMLARPHLPGAFRVAVVIPFESQPSPRSTV